MRIFFWIVIIAAALSTSFGLYLYFSHFNDGFSEKSEDWGVFGDYGNFLLNIANLLILGYISFVTFRTTDSFNRLQIRPLLFFTLDKPEKIKDEFKDSWYVVNGAKNAALNLMVRYTTGRNSEPYTKWVSCTSLAENQRLELFWIHYADQTQICFSDITNERFYLFEFMDYNGQTIEISRQEYNNIMQQAANNRDNNITHLRDKLEHYIASEKSKGVVEPMKEYTNNFIKKHIWE